MRLRPLAHARQGIFLLVFLLGMTSQAFGEPPVLDSAMQFLEEMQDQWHRQFWVFRSQDSGANVLAYGTQDKNGWTDFDVRLDDFSHPQAGLTNIRIEVRHPARGSWLGWHSLYPEGNWDGSRQGYDLRGSKTLRVNAMADRNNIKVQLRMRCRDQAGTIHSVFPLEAAFSAEHAVTLTDSYQTVIFDLSTLPASALTNVFELFSVIVPSSLGNPERYTIFLDDIRYDLDWRADPHLSDGLVPKTFTTDGQHMNRADVYDNALAGLALLALDTPKAKKRAAFIGESLLYAMNHSPNREVRLFNAYRSGMLYDRATGLVAFPGFWNKTQQAWQVHTDAVQVDTGNVCWAMLFFLELHKNLAGTPLSQQALSAASWLGDFLIKHLAAPGGRGFLLRMQPSIAGDIFSTYVRTPGLARSTEMNIDAMVAFSRLYKTDGQQKWLLAADSARDFLLAMKDPEKGVFCAGTDPDGKKSCALIAEDVQSWTILATRQSPYEDFSYYDRMLQKVENTLLYKPTAVCPYHGFDFSNADAAGPDGVWFEGTAQMALAYAELGRRDKADLFLSELERAIQEQSKQAGPQLGPGKGLPSACKDNLTTGLGWSYFNRPALAPTAWYILAKRQANPLAFSW